MPSPIGHILGGAAVYLASRQKQDHSRAVLGVVLLGSVLPDFDFLPGYFVGKLSIYHHGISHSLTFAALFGAAVFLCLKWLRSDIAKQAAVLGGLSYALHIILDFLGTNEGTRGVPMFWPFSDELFGLDLGLLGYFYYADSGIWSVVRWDNVAALLRELLVIGSPVLLLLWWKRSSTHHGPKLIAAANRKRADKTMRVFNE